MKPDPRTLTKPSPGVYLVPLAPHGWPAPARISLANARYTVELDGATLGSWTEEELEGAVADAMVAGELFDRPLCKVLVFGKQCTEQAYRHATATKEWARKHAPWHPSLSPTQPVDLRLLPPPTF